MRDADGHDYAPHSSGEERQLWTTPAVIRLQAGCAEQQTSDQFDGFSSS